MQLNLTEVVNLKVAIQRKINSLTSKRNTMLWEITELPQLVQKYDREIQIITSEIRKDMVNLGTIENILAEANTKENPEYGTTILEDINLIKRLRGELSQYESWANSTEKSVANRWEATTGYKVAKFTPSYWEQEAKELTFFINRKSREIDRRNFTTYVEVPFADLYI